jgi:hypothetical protein
MSKDLSVGPGSGKGFPLDLEARSKASPEGTRLDTS